MSGSLVLIGLSGSGKSTIGRALAHAIQLPFYDTDVLIETHTGISIRDYFSTVGEMAFRSLEETIISRVCQTTGVVASGGGAILRSQNRQKMRHNNLVVWLDVALDILLKRLQNTIENRPLLQGSLEENLHLLSKQRQHSYAQTAHLRIVNRAMLQKPELLVHYLQNIYSTWYEFQRSISVVEPAQ